MKCPVCGKEFVKNSGRQLYCSAKCKNKVMNEKKRKRQLKTDSLICEVCGEIVERRTPKQKYCPKCAEYMKKAHRKQWNEDRINKRQAEIGMRNIKKGKLDERLEECRRRGISYGQLQKELTLEKVRRGEL